MRQPHIDDYVRLTTDIPELCLHRGDLGVVRSTWFAPTTAYYKMRRRIPDENAPDSRHQASRIISDTRCRRNRGGTMGPSQSRASPAVNGRYAASRTIATRRPHMGFTHVFDGPRRNLSRGA